jgi:hypothetical protein
LNKRPFVWTWCMYVVACLLVSWFGWMFLVRKMT